LSYCKKIWKMLYVNMSNKFGNMILMCRIATLFTEARSLIAANTCSVDSLYSLQSTPRIFRASSSPVIDLTSICSRTSLCLISQLSRNLSTITSASPNRLVPSKTIETGLPFIYFLICSISSDRINGIRSLIPLLSESR
jgi:hypothetical protein